MTTNKILKLLHKVRKEVLSSIGGILVVIAITAIACSHFSYIKLEEPHEYLDYTLISNSEDMTLSIYTTIKEDMLGKTLVFYTSDSFVDAYIGDINIYHYGEESSFCKSPGSLYQIIQLPENISSIGEKIRIDIKTVYRNKFKDNYNIEISSSGGLILRSLKNEIFDILANIVLLILGVIMLIVYKLSKKNGNSDISIIYLGLACILTVIWSNCELFIFQLLLPTGVGQYYMYYCSFMILPMLLIIYFESISNKKIRFTIELYTHFCITLIMTILQITGIAEFTEMIVLYLVACILELISIVIKSIKYSDHSMPKSIELGLVILVACITINSLVYISNTTEHSSLLITKIGFIIYILISLFNSFEHLMVTMIYAKENMRMMKIALTDSLTNLGNRYAFDNDIKTISVNYLSIISIDLNNLKYFNDTYGHLCGDKLIKEASNILKNGFSGSIYRTGGDEFIILQAGSNDESIQKEIDNVQKLALKYTNNNKDNLTIEIACGYSTYKDGDKDYEDILKRADNLMYEHKSKLKKLSKIKYERT